MRQRRADTRLSEEKRVSEYTQQIHDDLRAYINGLWERRCALRQCCADGTCARCIRVPPCEHACSGD